MTVEAILYLETLFANTIRMMKSFVIPGTFFTPYNLMLFFIMLIVASFFINKFFGLEAGVFSSHYTELRKNGNTPKQSAGYMAKRYRRK